MSEALPQAETQTLELPSVPPVRVAVSWSGGKDCALALDLLLEEPGIAVVALLVSVTERSERVVMHGVRRDLVAAQASALGIRAVEMVLPAGPSNEIYAERLAVALDALAREGVEEIVFGDLFLEDVRAFREPLLAARGLRGRYPLWGRDTGDVALELVRRGYEAVVVCADPAKLEARFCGRSFDTGFLAELPPGVDPCGERGEFHTFVHAGPRFAHPVPVTVSPPELRDGFWYCDLA